MGKKIEWTEEKLEYIREHYPTEAASEIADAIGCSDTTVSVMAKKLGLTKSPDFHTWNYIGRYVKKGVVNNKKDGL